MKRLIKETLNEKVFVELYVEINESKVEYCISALFRYTHRSRTQNFDNLEKAIAIYKYITEN